MYNISWNTVQDAITKEGGKECRVGHDKGAPEIKSDVESHSTDKCKGLMWSAQIYQNSWQFN